MGTTLTGTTPQDTYDSLIKVTDNGPLSGSLKKLTDGLGNDSALSLSTGGASVTGTLAVSGNAAFDTNTLFVDAASNEVGIGTASPQSIFHIGAAAPANAGAKAYTGLASTAEGFLFDYYYDTNASNLRLFDIVSLGFATTGIGGSALRFLTVPQTTTNTPLERMRIDAAGNVGIGTSSPNVQLEVSAADNSLGGILRLNNNRNALFDGDQNGSIQFSNNESSGGANGVRSAILSLVRDAAGKTDLAFTTASSNGAASEKVRILADGGLTFNGDTAAANALDDYEEGEWTMGISFGGNSVGAAYILNTGRYTKIGRQVTASGYLAMSAKGSSTGDAAITGLPFTSGNTYKAITSASLRLDSVSFANAFQAYVDGPSTAISLGEITEAGVASNLTNADFSDSSAVMVSVTYTV